MKVLNRLLCRFLGHRWYNFWGFGEAQDLSGYRRKLASREGRMCGRCGLKEEKIYPAGKAVA